MTYANKLKEVGLTEDQAETIAQLQEEILIGADTNLATKNDLALLEQSIKYSLLQVDQKINSVEQTLEQKINSLEQSLIIKLGAMMTVILGLFETFSRLGGH